MENDLRRTGRVISETLTYSETECLLLCDLDLFCKMVALQETNNIMSSNCFLMEVNEQSNQTNGTSLPDDAVIYMVNMIYKDGVLGEKSNRYLFEYNFRFKTSRVIQTV